MKKFMLLLTLSFMLFIGNLNAINIFESDTLGVPTAIDTTDIPTVITKQYIDNIKISPNPVSDFFNIDVPYIHSMNIDIYNLNGVKVKTLLTHSNNNVNIGDLPKGMYIMLITFDDKFVTRKKLMKK